VARSAADLHGLGVAPPTALSSSATVMPIGNSYTPGNSQSPEMLNSFKPVDFSVPKPLNHAPPLAKIAAAHAKVSTLLTMVGLPLKPVSTGNGGRLRGSPRCPSSDSINAVSSPQT
jgi:hypothetical protein